ncbi:MAG TPA: efflux RND transporter periplasmic adaptor subunit [Polyangiaceae bacterium]|jgi:multidrug efflux system membrane fusion protein
MTMETNRTPRTTSIDEPEGAAAPRAERSAPAVKPAGHTNRWVMIVVGAAVLGGGGYVLHQRQKAAATASNAPPPERVIPVPVATVVEKDVPVWLEGLGNATPIATVNVKTLVDGRLDSVNFKEGQLVKKGDLLAQVDPRPFQIALHTAEATLARDSAQLRDARLNLDRYRTLRSQNLIAQQQVDDQQALADQYEATTHSDQAQIESAKLNLDYAHIVSPIDGVTGVRLVDPGNIVHASDQTYIVIITQLDPMAVLFNLPEDDLPRVQTQLAKGLIPVEAYSRDGLTKLATGRLALVDNEVNAATATIRLKALFPNKDRSLWPSEFVKARLLLSTAKDARVAPATAVQRGPNGTFAYVVAADNTVSVRPIEVLSTQGDDALIAKGLEVGERVVTDGQNQLKPGAKIQPKSPDAAKTARPAAPAPPGSGAPQAEGAPKAKKTEAAP